MMADYEHKYHLIEKKLWWFVARREMIRLMLSGMGVGKDARLLDVGCSGGVLISELRKEGYSEVYGIDLSHEAINICRESGISGVKVADACATGYEDASFDVVIASDILEHIRHGQKAMIEWRRIVKRGGMIIVFVPAFMLLWGPHDRSNRHFRRYSWPELKRLIEGTGLFVVRYSCWNIMLFFPTLVMRLAKKLVGNTRAGDEFIMVPHGLNLFLTGMLRCENRLLEKISIPVGVSLFAVVRKP